MQLTHVLVLACSTLALAKPYHPRSGGEWHHPYKHKPGCSSASTGAGAVSAASASASGYYTNSSSAALPYSVGPTVVTGAPTAGPTAGGGPLSPLSSPSEGGVTASSSTALAPVQSSSTTVKAPTSTVAAAPVQSSTAAAAPVSGGTTYTATFTEYGAGDSFGSGNCNTATAACGWYSNPGYNAAASQNLFGVGPGAGAGPACGLCFQLTAKTNPYNNDSPLTGTKSIVVKVNNLCPASGNPLCSQSSLTSTNSLGGEVNFDLCKDDGAAAALFGSSGVTAALGSATQVSCDQWSGSSNLTS